MKGWPSAWRLVALGLGIALANPGCGGPSPQPAEPAAPGASGERPGEPAPPAAEAPLTEAECLAALEHFLEVSMAEKRATLPPEQVPTAEQVASIRDTMRTSYLPECVGGPRTGYDCAMQATTTAAMETCLQDTGTP